ncbi:MAG: hypothetical protein MJA83_09140, partial [Gammaproteobacteria bacterium]|nr:hypothetical protein [Gammaproteobacteria bacterium]
MPRLILIILLLATTLFTAADTALADTIREDSSVVRICIADDAAETTLVWVPNVTRAIRDFQPVVDEVLPYAVRPTAMSECEPLIAKDQRVSACYGGADGVYCDAEALAMLLRIVAWMSAFSAVPKSKPDGGVAQFDPIPVLAAQALAHAAMTRDDDDFERAVSSIVYDGGLSSEDFDRAQITFIAIHHLDTTDELLPIADEADTPIAYGIYFSTVNYVMAFIVGHELYHAHGGCGPTGPSSSESSGTFELVTKLQTSGLPLCLAPPFMGEVAADRCALRALERTDAALLELVQDAGELAAISLSLSRRYAIDAIGILLLHGLGYDFSHDIELDNKEVRHRVHMT